MSIPLERWIDGHELFFRLLVQSLLGRVCNVLEEGSTNVELMWQRVTGMVSIAEPSIIHRRFLLHPLRHRSRVFFADTSALCCRAPRNGHLVCLDRIDIAIFVVDAATLENISRDSVSELDVHTLLLRQSAQAFTRPDFNA